ncbi:hypothetical protein [Kitasatospora sp. NPDC096204]|uniref:hypothetical protein n=1 Tax=Kitasatospora sp. NPDC096204 TaxID=3364094 RepID=UPI0038038B1E
MIQAGQIHALHLNSSPASRSRRSANADAENDALDGLAREVLDRWRDEASARGLHHPVPMAIPWELE